MFGEQLPGWQYQQNVFESMSGAQNDSHGDEVDEPPQDRTLLNTPGFPSEEAIRVLYLGTPEISPIRALVADMCAYATVQDEVRKPDFNHLPREALVDVLDPIPKMKSRLHARSWSEYTEGCWSMLERSLRNVCSTTSLYSFMR